jgi:hypothetical protein
MDFMGALHLFHGIRTFLWSARTMRHIQDTSELPQNTPDCACGARKGLALSQQLLVAMEVVENRSWPWRPLEVLRRVFTNLHNPLHNTGMDLWIGGVMGSRLREQHLQIIGRSCSQSLQPLFHPTQGATQSVSEILLGPLRMFMGQAAESGPIGDPFDFHSELHLPFFPSMTPVKPHTQPLSFHIFACLLGHDEGKPGDEEGKQYTSRCAPRGLWKARLCETCIQRDRYDLMRLNRLLSRSPKLDSPLFPFSVTILL